MDFMGGDKEKMNSDKLMAIKELMDELVGEMQPDKDEFDMRLGKPKVDVVAMKGEMPMEGDLEDPGAEPSDSDDDDDDLFGSPEDKFKQRLMKLRG